MRATSEYELHDFQSAFFRATQAALAAHGLDDARIERANAELPPSYQTIGFELLESINASQHPTQPGRGMVDDTFTATLTIGIRTERMPETPAFKPGVADLHAEIESLVRVALMPANTPFTATTLPYYRVINIGSGRTRRSTDPVFMEDFTELTFSLTFGLKAEAWPV